MKIINYLVRIIRIFIAKEIQKALLNISPDAIVRFVPTVTTEFFGCVPKNIEWQLQLNALRLTARYVDRKMCMAKPLSSRTEVLSYAISNSKILDGLFLEFGVFKGSSINFIAKKVDVIVHGFDSFDGLPECWREGFNQGAFRVEDVDTLEFVENVCIHKGIFEETIPLFLNIASDTPISFLHIDCDLYSSTRTIFKYLGGNLINGSIIVFDEYMNYPGWQYHEFKAFQEYARENNVLYEYIAYNKLDEQVVVRILS